MGVLWSFFVAFTRLYAHLRSLKKKEERDREREGERERREGGREGGRERERERRERETYTEEVNMKFIR